MQWFWKNRYLCLRRVFQLSILTLFILGNLTVLEVKNPNGFHTQMLQNTPNALVDGVVVSKANASVILSGDLSFSKILDVIPLSDPFASLQLFLAGGVVALDIWLGVLLVVLFYGIFAGRAYCAYVCPINLVTDFASFLRAKLGLNALKGVNLPRGFKYGVLGVSLLLSFVFALPAFEMINPVSALSRGLIFGMGFGILGVLFIFLFDLFVLKNGFCGYVCPIGAMFSLIGKFGILKVRHRVQNCTKCMKCVEICPEHQVLEMVGKRSARVNQMACMRCGRCIEVCQDHALEFSIFGGKNEGN